MSAYFETPEEVRAAQAVLKQAGILPLEVQLLQEIAESKEEKATAQSVDEPDRITELLNRKQLKLNLLRERLRQQVK